jgi:hypothetical protein
MNVTPEQQKKILIVLIALIALINVYTYFKGEKPRTAPLTYGPGAVAASSVRTGVQSREADDPLQVFLVQRQEKFPGVSRDIFRMENPNPVRPIKKLITKPTHTVVLPPPVPQKTAEEIAADAAKLDLSKFRFLGYLTGAGKDSSLFLSKEGETFIARSGDRILKSYRIKEASKDSVVLQDTVTKVEVKIELSGGGDSSPQKSR